MLHLPPGIYETSHTGRGTIITVSQAGGFREDVSGMEVQLQAFLTSALGEAYSRAPGSPDHSTYSNIQIKPRPLLLTAPVNKIVRNSLINTHNEGKRN